MKAYMTILTGQGDTDVSIVTKEIFDWINSPFPSELNGKTGLDPYAPESVVEQIRKDNEGFGFPDDEHGVSIGSRSYENDRALQMGEQCIKRFFDMKSAFDYVRENDVEIVDTYEGYIY